MNCSQCYAPYDDKAQYCSQCGTKTIYNIRSNTNSAVTGLWLYVGFLLFQSLWYRALSFMTSRMYAESIASDVITHVNTLYTLTLVITTLIELGILGYIIFSVKNTSARIAVAVFAIFTFIMFAWDIVQQMSRGHWF